MSIGTLWAAATALCVLANKPFVTAESKGEHEIGGDDDSDSAPFMVVLQHDSLHSCGGSLVSPRTVLTSAWCARGGAPGDGAAALWALAPGARRRVVRAALAHGEPLRPGWLGAAGDIAVLELEQPFDSDAGARPILTAGAPDDCGAGAVCHVVRARGSPPRLRIVDAARVPGDDACGAVASGWPALRDSALCLSGPTLCSMDRGAGVVCDGQLCGVLSRSGRSDAWRGSSPADEDASCGDVHVALSVARWRRFLHCAHILRACGREDGECAQQCTERRLVTSSDDTIFSRTDWPREDVLSETSPNGDLLRIVPTRGAPSGYVPSAVPPSSDAPSEVALPPGAPDAAMRGEVSINTVPNDPVPGNLLTTGAYMPAMLIDPTRTTMHYKNLSTTWEPMIRATTPARSLTATEQSSASRPSFEFEPNRADFKAGEYGDNAADYGAAEEVAAGSGDRAPSTSVDPAPGSRGVPASTLRSEPTLTWHTDSVPAWRADPTLSWSGDNALTWRADPAPTSRAVPEPTPRAAVNHTRTSVPIPEDMQRTAGHPRAAAMSMRTHSFVTFAFAAITLLVTN